MEKEASAGSSTCGFFSWKINRATRKNHIFKKNARKKGDHVKQGGAYLVVQCGIGENTLKNVPKSILTHLSAGIYNFYLQALTIVHVVLMQS